MKIALGLVNKFLSCGIIEGNEFLVAKENLDHTTNAVQKLIQNGQSFVSRKTFKEVGTGVPINKVDFQAPISKTNKIICVGINYPKIYNDKLQAKPENIIIFSRHLETIVGHNAPLKLPSGSAKNSFDYEGEIAIVIGEPAFKVSPKNAMKHIFGYTLFNDGSVRDWQKSSLFAGKNFFQSGACGPYIVTKDEILEFESIILETKVNGKTVQEARLSEMFFSIQDLLSYISNIIPLNSGDIIATGSPEGTGANQTPPRFLRQGDTIDILATNLGQLHNYVDI